jgi:hypothetical protein
MVRDPQAALVALNRFGFGARGGASSLSSLAKDITAGEPAMQAAEAATSRRPRICARL